MSADHSSQKLNAIVGAALRALALAGAEDEVLGAFAAEHRVKVAEILGISSQAPVTVDLQTIITNAVTEGVRQSHLALGLGGGLSHAKSAKGAVKRVYVTVAGKRTSLTVPNDLFERVATNLGGLKPAMKVIREYANQAPANKKRSSWTEQQLTSLLTLSNTDGAAAARH